MILVTINESANTQGAQPTCIKTMQAKKQHPLHAFNRPAHRGRQAPNVLWQLIRKAYHEYYFHNRPTWDIQKQARGEPEEEYSEPVIEFRISERASSSLAGRTISALMSSRSAVLRLVSLWTLFTKNSTRRNCAASTRNCRLWLTLIRNGHLDRTHSLLLWERHNVHVVLVTRVRHN
jgi:hypothetical protein